MQKTIFTIALLFFYFTTEAQNVQSIKDSIKQYVSKIENLRNDTSESQDSLNIANLQLGKYIESTVMPLSFGTHFSKAEIKSFDIVQSSDNKLRMFTWDTWTGGTEHRYSSTVAVKIKKRILFFYINDGFSITTNGDTLADEATSSYYEITNIRTKDNTIVYLFFGESRESTSERGETLVAYKILNDSLVKAPFFKTRTKTFTSISYDYNAFAFYNKHPKAKLPNMHLSKDNKKLYIPVVDGEDMTIKCLVYVFDGNNYVFDKNAK